MKFKELYSLVPENSFSEPYVISNVDRNCHAGNNIPAKYPTTCIKLAESQESTN